MDFYVWDGQHRKEAACSRGLEYLLCDVTIGLTVEEEARLFGCQANGIKKPNPYDIFKAHVCEGEVIDTAIKKACDKYDRKSSSPRCLSCLTISRNIFGRRHEEYFYWILDLLEKAAWYNSQNVIVMQLSILYMKLEKCTKMNMSLYKEKSLMR